MELKDSEKTVIVIAGPTAVGKTAVCVELAMHYKTEIVSADSRQFYKEMNIGTAKPSIEELAAVPHHLVDHLSIHESYTVKDFESEALNIVRKIHERSSIAILSGGSGLFVQAFCEGLDEMPPIPEGVRYSLNERYQKEGLEVLLNELSRLDPEYFMQVDKANPQRVIRALEVISHTGKRFSHFRKRNSADRPFKMIKIGLQRDREELYQRIDSRMDAMIQAGLFEEAENLFPFRHLNALQTVGYAEIFRFLEGEYDRVEAIRLLKRNSRRYAKRQMTWFNKYGDFTWFEPDNIQGIIQFIDDTRSPTDA